MRKAFYALLLSGLFIQKINGQSLTPQVIGATGGYVITNGHSLSYTTGELAVKTASNNSNTLTQGFQQPNDIYLAVKNVTPLPYAVQVYPNPTMDNVLVKIPPHNGVQGCTVILTDVLGKVLDEVTKNNTGDAEINIPMRNYAAGAYLLNITDGNKNTSTYKVIKVQ